MAVTTKPPENHHLLLPSISIDMSSFTHSELHSLSLLSSSNDAVSFSTANAQFFINPSLSTHQQTYSLSPHPRRHRFSLLNQERSESNSIVSFLRKHLQFDDSAPAERLPEKRGENLENVTVEIVNRNGEVVNLATLEEREIEGGPFAEELRRRAEGRVKEEELLEMLAAMEGDWCSRRRKRRVVDASFLGDALPVGWKLIIALRRKGGHFTPYCRRYISPTGEQLSSCKEVSSYLKSYFGINDAKLVGDSMVDFQQPQVVDSVNHGRLNTQDCNSLLDTSNSTMLNTCVSIEHEEASILGIDNLPDVQICDLYECHACNISFDMKDKYLQHVLSLHQNTTRRYTLESSVEDKVIIKEGKPECRKRRKRRRLGSSVGDGVIIKDGKYECQFCHKVFEERRRYLGHVGNHVKGSIKNSKDAHVQVNGCAKSPTLDRLPAVINSSRMDALIEIAQSSIQDIDMPLFEKEPASVNNIDPLSVAENFERMDVCLKAGKNSSSCFDNANEEKYFRAEIYPCEVVSGISSVCPNEKDIGGGKTSSEELHLPCDEVTEMSMTDTDIGHLDFTEHEGGDIGEDTSLSSLLNLHDNMGEMRRTDGNFNDPTSCSNEGELGKDARNDETLSTELNPLSKFSNISSINGVMEAQTFTCNVVDSEKDYCSEMTMTPAAKNGIAENVSVNGKCESTTAEGEEESADEPRRLFNIHYVRCNGKASNLVSSGEKLDHVHKCVPEHAQKFNGSELVAVSGKNHASACAAPQISLNSSPFDEIEKAGQNICSLDQNLEGVTGLEYMKLDVIEPQMYKYSSLSREDSISFYEVSMDLGNNIGLGLGLDNSLKSQSEFPQEMAGKCLTTTLCVWCGVEFSHEIIDFEPQPDSVGFMCPACRAKISKQFNDLESNFEFSLF